MQHFFHLSIFPITVQLQYLISTKQACSLSLFLLRPCNPRTVSMGPWEAKGAEGFLEAGNMPIRPTSSYPTQRAGPGPVLQHPAKTTNCNYLRKCLSFEVFFFFSPKERREKTMTEGLRLHRASLMLIWSRMLEQNMKNCVHVCV